MTTEGIDIHSVGNTLVLHQTALIEAFNLKAAIDYQLKNCKNLGLAPRPLKLVKRQKEAREKNLLLLCFLICFCVFLQ